MKKIDLRPTQILQIEALAQFLNMNQIASYLGICDETFKVIRKRQPAVDTAYKKGRSKAIELVAQTLLNKAIEGDNACMMFYLKTQAGWQETHKKEVSVEHSAKQVESERVSDTLEFIRKIQEGLRKDEETLLN